MMAVAGYDLTEKYIDHVKRPINTFRFLYWAEHSNEMRILSTESHSRSITQRFEIYSLLDPDQNFWISIFKSSIESGPRLPHGGATLLMKYQYRVYGPIFLKTCFFCVFSCHDLLYKKWNLSRPFFLLMLLLFSRKRLKICTTRLFEFSLAAMATIFSNVQIREWWG